MKLKSLILIFVICISFSTFAENLELFEPIPGAVRYEIYLLSEEDKSVRTVHLETPVLDTDAIPAGNYIMRARYQNIREKWSPWTDKASLKIVKKIKNSTRDVFDDKFPFGGSAGLSNLTTELISGSYRFESDETVVRTRGMIQRQAYKINVVYDKSTNFTRFDAAVLKQITPNVSSGLNFWLVNFDGRNISTDSDGLINYTQSFFELDYMYPFLDRWYAGAKFGLGWGISYFIKPEITYSVPFGDEFFLSASLLYETSQVKQSAFEFNVSGFGALVNLNYFLEI